MKPVLVSAPSYAQTTAPGPYYATPSWDQQLSASTRFIVLSNWSNAAVLDRETGLVWQRTSGNPNSPGSSVNRFQALLNCWDASTGGRKGWRMPRIEELLSLGEPPALGGSPLPPGHPFLQVIEGFFWAIDVDELPGFGRAVHFTTGSAAALIPADAFSTPVAFTGLVGAWCVRGGQGSPGTGR
jgi:Protein of unknown function (DUF1566)